MDRGLNKRNSVTVRVNRYALALLLFALATLGLLYVVVASSAGTIAFSATLVVAVILLAVLVTSVSLMVR